MTTISRPSLLSFVLPGLIVACLGFVLLMPGTSHAAVTADASTNAGSISLDQPAYTAHEDQGELTITIQLTGDLTQVEHVGYGVKAQDAQAGVDFEPVNNTYITLQPGQSSYTFNVPIIDQGLNGPPVYALAYLYSAWPDSLGANTNSMVTILRDDSLAARDVANPLGVPTPVNGNLIAGTKFYVDPDSSSAKAARHYARSKPAWSRLLDEISAEPDAHRFYMWNMGANVEGQVTHYLEATQIQQPGSTVMLSTYNLIHGRRGSTATPAVEARYDAFMSAVAQGIGNTHVVFYLELDSLIDAPSLNPGQLAIRDAELKYAISVLEADPHVLVYLDGGAADAASAARQARYLSGAGVAQTQGFFLNSTHFDWTTSELQYGQHISALLGGAHFVINTGENGRGPLRPANRVKNGNEVLCNPAGRGLGPLSLQNDVAQSTGYAGADAFLWFSNPGGSGGQCVPGAPPTGVYWPAYAVKLAKRWNTAVSGPRFALNHQGASILFRR